MSNKHIGLMLMLIFDENQVVSDLNKCEFMYPMDVKIIKFLIIDNTSNKMQLNSILNLSSRIYLL